MKIKKVGRGGPAHYYWCLTLQNYFNNLGYQSKLEAELSSGIFTDILLIKNNQRIAVEVVITDKDKRAIKKLGQLLKLMDGVIMAFNKNELKKRIQKEVEEFMGKDLKKVRFNLVGDFQ